jgi:dTDP-4-dehydrorhamnose reductase
VILVVGGHGQLGQELATLAAERGVPLHAVSRQEADISNRDAVARQIAQTRPTMVVNAGAYTNVDRAETDVEAATRSNETGPAVLADLCSERGLPLVHISTDYVFDGTKPIAYVESDPVAPINVYGRTKAAGEAAIRKRHPRHVILRTSWLYGRFGSNVLKTVLRLASEGTDLRFVIDQRGCPTSTLDIARAILHMAPRLQGDDDVWGTFHLAGSGATTWHGFVGHVVDGQAQFTGRRPSVTAITTAELARPAPRPQNSELDSSRFADVFGFRTEPWQAMTDWTVRRLLAPEPGVLRP